jgi:ligand-binding sensor domain-containing protein
VLSEKVYSITTDGNNNVWIGSLEGVSKFDGQSWKTYTKSNSVLRSNVINALLADKQNRIWVGTPKGIYVIVNGTLMDYSFNLPDQNVMGIAESKGGIIWTAISGGVCKFNNSTWQQFTVSNSGLNDNYPMCIAIDSSDKVWVGSRYYGLSILDGTTWSYLTTTSLNIAGIEPGVGSIHFSEDGTIWVSTLLPDYDRGRVVYFKNNLWSHYSRPELNNNHTKQIRTWKGNVLFATKSGLGILNNMNEFKFFRTGNTKLWDMNTYQTAIDRDGNIWFGTSICGAGKVKKILN